MRQRRQQNLLESGQIQGQLKGMDKGGYARTYRNNGRAYGSSLHVAIARLLDALGSRYEVDSPIISGSKVTADFLVDGRTLLFVERGLSPLYRKAIADSGRSWAVVTTSSVRSDSLDSGIRVTGMKDGGSAPSDRGDGREAGRLQSIFLDDPSFNFDYAHILPKTEKCSVMHGHTSSALVEIVGSPGEGMVVDFNDAKPMIKKAIADLDHKLFINESYVIGRTKTHVDLAFATVHGDFSLHVPKDTTVLIDGEATVENLARELLGRIAPKMPANVEAVGVYVYEGLNKGTHLLAQIQRKEAEKKRMR
ncbi:MAG: 6-carboxytetrahydropterin synthase [Thaumarchaeota archaeon]|nr:6-carboxytetrahydropterin synthase [Nitrososphaerota archaeon]